MNQYISIFIDKDYPIFINKYLPTKTLQRLKHKTQFCGNDYTKFYSSRFLYTRFGHSLVAAHMTWHFTHNKKETIAALLHDVGTPCFAHCIDYVFDDYMIQESSEKNIVDVIKMDDELISYLEEDGLSVEDFEDYSNFHILENESPKLCTDRLDDVLHTCYIWLHTHSLQEVKEVYDNMVLLQNEDNIPEIGFKDINIAEKFVSMFYTYAKELQGNTDKYTMKYISEIVKLAFEKKLISLDDLYEKEEESICNIFESYFPSWKKFNNANELIRTDVEPNNFYISFDTKKRNTIPLVQTESGNKRIIEVSSYAKTKYEELENYKDSKYAYVEEIKSIDENNITNRISEDELIGLIRNYSNKLIEFDHNKETIEKSIIKTRFDRLSDSDKKLVTFLCNQAQYLSRFIIIWSLLELVTSIYNKDVDSSIIYALGTAMHISFLRLLKYLNTEIADEEEEEIISDSYDKDTIIKNNETAIDFIRSLSDKEKEKYLCLKLS